MSEFEKINEERRKKGLPPLTRSEYETSKQNHKGTDDEFWHFIVAYNTGFPMPSGMGVLGAMMSPNSVFSSHSEPTPSPSYSASDPSPSIDSSSSYSPSSDTSSYSDGGSSGSGSP